MTTVKAVLKLLCFGLLCLLIFPTQGTVLLFTKGPKSYVLPRLWYKAVAAVFGLRVRKIGTPRPPSQTLYMGNHVSYLDIVVIGSLLKASFVAKSEVSGWPLFGALSKLQQTAYIERKRSAIHREKDALKSRIARGEALIIFPEGTSSEGVTVLPFKSSLFSLALGEEAGDLYVQPVTLRIKTINGQPPQTQDERDLYAWHLNMDMPLEAHIWRFAQTTGAQIDVIFHPAIRARDIGDRKILAAQCQEAVLKGLENMPLAA